MIRHFIIESGNHAVAPSITGVHKTHISALQHWYSIRTNYRLDGYAIVENTDSCFTVQKGEETCIFELQAVEFD
jgi:hypothetical protein